MSVRPMVGERDKLTEGKGEQVVKEGLRASGYKVPHKNVIEVG